MRKLRFISSATAFVLLLAGFGIAGAAEKENGKRKALDPDGISSDSRNGTGRTGPRQRFSAATGAVRFVGIEDRRSHGDLMASSGAEAPAQSRGAFLSRVLGIFGLRDVDARNALIGRSDRRARRPSPRLSSSRTAACPSSPAVLRTHFEATARLVGGQREPYPRDSC